MTQYVLGIDVGTQGARVVACDRRGTVIAHAESPFNSPTPAPLPPGWAEQSLEPWWEAVVTCLRTVTAQIDPSTCAGISVTSTSGTVCLLSPDGEPLRPALMYNDGRAQAEAAEANRAGAALCDRLGYRFNASYALCKLAWLSRHESANFAAAGYLASPTDFIIGRLCGQYGVTDFSNALKTGYDLIENCWPRFIEQDLAIPLGKLPRVMPPGAEAGRVTSAAARQTGLAKGQPVLAGMTDGCASQVSTGAVEPGQWNSTVGTTLVIKGVTREIIRDPAGRVYCHRHPDGFWLPGGASSTGGEGLTRRFAAASFDALNRQVLQRTPTDLLVYPLARTGERFPFNCPAAEGFVIGRCDDEATLYAAYLEGVGYVERMAYGVLQDLGAEVGDQVYVAGGANSSAAWLQVRADILDKALLVAEAGGGAKGAAIVAAGSVFYDGIVPAARGMVRIERTVVPDPRRVDAYDQRYRRFRDACAQRGYLG